MIRILKIVFVLYTTIISVFFWFLLNNLKARDVYSYSQGLLNESYKNRYLWIVNHPKTITVEKEKIIYIPTEGKVEIKNGELKVKSFGVTSRIGFQTSLFPLLAGPDMKVLFWNRLGLNIGYLDYGVTGTISYKLDRLPMITNSELFIGENFRFNLPAKTIVGLRINL